MPGLVLAVMRCAASLSSASRLFLTSLNDDALALAAKKVLPAG